MKDFFENTRRCMDKYNELQEKMLSSSIDTTDEEDEFLDNFQDYLSSALIDDYGIGWARQLNSLIIKLQIKYMKLPKEKGD